jgi:hypothetical protein
VCVSPFEKKAENPSRLAWPFQLQGGLVLLPVTIPVKPSTPAGAGPVVRETGGASLRLPTAAVLDSSLQGWPQSFFAKRLAAITVAIITTRASMGMYEEPAAERAFIFLGVG